MGEVSLTSTSPANISSICTIWAQQEVTAGQAGGIPVADLVAEVHNSLADRVVRMVRRLRIEKEVILTGGCAKNIGLVKALSGYLGQEVLVPEEPLITGALGAALLGRDIWRKAAAAGGVPETRDRVGLKQRI